MKKILMIVLPFVLLTACVDSLEDWNIDQKRAKLDEAPARTLFTSAQKNFLDIITTPNVNSNNFRMFVQHWATTTYLDEPRYNMTSRLYSQNQWNAAYRDVIADLRECKRLIEVQTDASTNLIAKANQLAVAEVMEIYTWFFLVNTFGDVPYSEALIATNSLPKYDDAQTIYTDLLARLDVAIATLTANSASVNFPTSATTGADLFYGNAAGSTPKWVKLANTIKLKMGMLLADKDNAKAKSVVESAVTGGVFTANTDNARLAYLSAAPNNNPVSQNLNASFTSREDFVVANTLVDAMNTLADPRRVQYFTTVSGNYVGGIYGFSNAYASFSHVSAKIIAPTFEGLLLDYSETEFLLAEAVERGYTVGGTAASHYDAAITASILYWGGTALEATTYLAQPAVAYATAAGDYKQKIGTQKWIALNNRGWDAWVEWRRLDQPVLLPPSGASIPDPLTIPKRMIYPVNEQTVNGAQWATAAAKFNNDDPKIKLFWDVN